MGLSANIRQQLVNSFKTEQSEHVQKINQGLLALEKNPDAQERQALLNEIFREAHSLKGAARAVGVTTVESIGHSLEELLLNAKEGRLTFSPELFDLLYQALDAIDLLVKKIESGNSTPPARALAVMAHLEETVATIPEEQASNTSLTNKNKPGNKADEEKTKSDFETSVVEHNLPSSPHLSASTSLHTDSSASNPKSKTCTEQSRSIQNLKSDETIRVSVSKLDTMMAQFNELAGAKIRAEQRLAEIRQFQTFAAEWQKEWLALRSHHNRLVRDGYQDAHTKSANGHSQEMAALVEFATHNQEQLRIFNTQSNTFYRQLSNDTMRLSLIIDELQEEIKQVRMLPLSTITVTFGRMVRDLAREQSKHIELTITGDEIELDKRVLEQIKDPLIHLLRNAIDHGLETPAEREQVGKPTEGQIFLSASQQGNNVVIAISDDGRGLDLAAIRQSAVRKGFLAQADAEKLNDAEAAMLIFNSSLSTSKIITDISGRGVGLDVVRKNVEKLHGTLDVDFEPEEGTKFTMTLPLTLVNSQGLLVKAGEQTFVLPHATVERMLWIERSAIANVEGKEAITYQDQPMALAWLEDLLELPPGSRDAAQLTVVIIRVVDKRLGLIVDSLVGEQEIVMKDLGKQLSKVGGIAGATVLGSGQVTLVLHAADLIKLARKTRSQSTRSVTTHHNGNQEQQKTILVVDDSITTRTLEKNILEAAGYNVKLATNGEEALGVLVSDDLPNLVVSDVNMPRLNGFDLTNRIKQDDRYGNIPVILVTSLDSSVDKARGIKVGADAYIVKSKFDQGNLLETIEQLV